MVTYNIMSVMSGEYDVVTEVTNTKEEYSKEDMCEHKLVCYYVMNDGCVEEQNAIIERPDMGMIIHLGLFFIKEIIDNVGVNKVLIDSGTVFNLMPHYLLKIIGKFDTNLMSHNMVLSNYEENIGHSLGVNQVDLVFRTIVRPILFMVIVSKTNYNLLLGREWIHRICIVSSYVYQLISIWREDGIVENIEVDQSYYMVEVNHVTKTTFDKSIMKIASCLLVDQGCIP